MPLYSVPQLNKQQNLFAYPWPKPEPAKDTAKLYSCYCCRANEEKGWECKNPWCHYTHHGQNRRSYLCDQKLKLMPMVELYEARTGFPYPAKHTDVNLVKANLIKRMPKIGFKVLDWVLHWNNNAPHIHWTLQPIPSNTLSSLFDITRDAFHVVGIHNLHNIYSHIAKLRRPVKAWLVYLYKPNKVIPYDQCPPQYKGSDWRFSKPLKRKAAHGAA